MTNAVGEWTSRHRRAPLALGSSILGASLAIALSASAAAEEITWVGGTNLDWNTAANWNPRQVPGVDVAGASVVIPGARGLIVATLLPLSLGEVHFSTGVRFAGSFVTLQGGEATDLELTNDAEVYLLSPLKVSGTTQWIHGRVDGGALLENEGTLFTPTTSQVRTLRTPLKNLGTFSQGGKLNVAGGADITNVGTWELPGAGSANLQEEIGDPIERFVNQGVLKRTGAGSTELAVEVEQQAGASIVVNGGEVLFKRGSDHQGGTYTMANNAALRIWPDSGVTSTFSGDVTLKGLGNVAHHSGTLHVESGATLRNELDLGSAFGLHFVGAGSTIDLGGTLHNAGRMTWDAGTVQGSGVLENGSTGTLVLISPGSLKTTLRNEALGQVFHNGNVFLDGGSIDVRADSTWTIGNGSLFQLGVGGGMTLSGTLEKLGTLGNPTLLGAPIAFDGGSVFAQGPGNLSFLAGGSVNGESTVTTADGQLTTFAGGTWTLQGTLTMNGGGAFTAGSGTTFHASGGSLVNGHPANVECLMTGTTLTAGSADDVTVRNEGKLKLSSCTIGTPSNPNGRVQNAKELLLTGELTVRGTLHNEPNASVGQNGFITLLGGSLVNGGKWTQVFGDIIGDARSSITNQPGAIIRTFANSTFAVTLDNQGTVDAEAGVLILGNVVQVQGSVLTGGTWIVWNNAKLVFAGASVTKVGPGTRLAVLGNDESDFLAAWTGVDAGGELELTPTTELSLEKFHELKGRMILNGGPGTAVNIDGELESILGDIDEVFVGSFADGLPPPTLRTPRLHNGGRIRPGGPAAIGGFHLEGTLEQTSTGTVAIEIAGASAAEVDRVDVVGDVALAGTLELTFLDGYVPEPGDAFDVLGATGTISGSFDHVVAPGARFTYAVHDGLVTAAYEGPAILGDLDGDGAVGPIDLGVLLGAWGTSGTADLDGNGDVGAPDLAILLGAWTS